MPHVTARLDCSICLLLEDDAASWDWVVLVGCGHIYHDRCIRKWCETPVSETSSKKRNTCPECRTKIVRVPSDPSDSRSHSQSTKNNTRFKKVILNVQEDVIHSSSPVKRATRTSSPAVTAAAIRNRRTTNNNVVESSEEESELEEEQEEQAEGAGPSNADATGAGNARQQRENQRMIGEMRALITSKNTALEQKDAQLAETLVELADLREQLQSSKFETEDVLRRREVCMTELGNAKKEKAQLARSLEKEVTRHQSTRMALNQATNEISTLKQEKQDLSRQYALLFKSNEDHLSTCEDRMQGLEAARQKFEKLHQHAASGNASLKHQLEKERLRRKDAEGKLAKYASKDADGQSVKKVDKGKKRMIYQDDEDDQEITIVEKEEEVDDFEIPMASTSMSQSRAGIKDYDISAEDSLQIDDFPHSRRMDLQDGYEQDNFDDLDSVHPITATSTTALGPHRQLHTSSTPKKTVVPSWYSTSDAAEQKENISKKRFRDDGIFVDIPSSKGKVLAKGKETLKDRSKSQEYMNQVLTQNSKTIALGEKKRSKYFHK